MASSFIEAHRSWLNQVQVQLDQQEENTDGWARSVQEGTLDVVAPRHVPKMMKIPSTKFQ